MPQPHDITRLRASRDAALATAIGAEEQLRALDAAIARADRAGGGPDVARLRTERARVQATAETARLTSTAAGEAATAALSDWLTRSPEEIVNACTDQMPFVLLPVRMETSFAASATSRILRVRLYPDDISVAAPLAAVSDDERALGVAYWKARSASRQAAGNDRLRADYEGSWTTLATRAGAYRAGYVVRETAPTNPDAAPDDLHFNAPPPAVQPPIARADLLPDRFVVLAYVADPTTKALHEVARAVGAPIPDNLVLAPEGHNPESFLSRDEATGRLIVPDALKWMVEYDAAVAVGMAVTIPLAPPHDSQGFDRVIAVGVRSSTPPEEGSAALQALFEKHRYGNGCAVLPAGTPTNNSETASGWQQPSGDAKLLLAVEEAPPDPTEDDGPVVVSDGTRIGRLFGFDEAFVRKVPYAARTDVADALAMNRAAAPGTLDDFVEGFLAGLVNRQTAADLHSFFVSWVSGRGLYPALRIGRQPYGVVVTSAWGRWKFLPNSGHGVAPALYDLIGAHRFKWQVLGRRAPHAAQQSPDPFQRLLSIVGLLASSSEFVSRKAVSDEYIRQRMSFGGADAAAIQQWFNELRAIRNQSLAAIDFPPSPGPTDPLLAFIVFMRDTAEWRLPIVDRDPEVPLSEDRQITPYDGAHNYLWWLTQASRDDLTTQRMVGADGTVIAPPNALLYIVLRRAVLAALESAVLDAARLHGVDLFGVVGRDPLIANIGETQHVQRRDYLSVDASRLGLASTPKSLADWTLDGSRLPSNWPPPAERLAEVQQAIAVLANLSTAQLERLIAEHLDLCSYRLDAWITAIYAQRLAGLRVQQPTGLHLGTFGWVENLRPNSSNRTPVGADAIPEALQDAAGSRIFEDALNGGYIHAPSLAQAASAAVLRNGYLSHASSAQPQTFAVNLSSGRMRAAATLADGVRGGQPITALLGYQFERGLHEGHPGIELDRFIGPFRDRFPLLSGRLTELPPGTKADVIEARNVVDGLALVEAAATQTYPYGVTDLPAPASAQGQAIQAEIDRLRDALDAVSDLLMAESVHQAVNGNLARTQAAQQALSSPAPPPEADIIRTPRTGRVLTFRVALALDADDVSGWTTALSPRARANPQLNHWLSLHLPAPGNIQWRVQTGTAPAQEQSADGLGLEPIDMILMSGDRLGDRSSELERYLVRHFSWTRQVPDDQAVTVDFSQAGAGAHSLGSLQPLLSRLRRLIARSRPAHAADWRRAADAPHAQPDDTTGSATGHPRLVHVTDLTDRVSAARTALTIAHTALENAQSVLAPLREAFAADPATITNPSWIPALDGLRHALFVIVPFGVPEAVPTDGLTVTPTLVDRLGRQAKAVSTIVHDRLTSAEPLLATAFVEPLPTDEPARTIEAARRNDRLRQSRMDAASALLGPAFAVMPLFRFSTAQAAEAAQSLAAPAAEAATVEDWLFSASRVRPQIADVVWTLAATRWTGRAISDPGVVQFPHRAGSPWIGGEFGEQAGDGEWLSLAVLNSEAVLKPLQAGLLIDEWTETAPASQETTAVAFNFNRPNAVAPQAVLVAVPPELRGHWTFDDLVGSVHEALDLAKMRAVEPDALLGKNPDDPSPSGAYFQALPALLAEFTSGRLAVADFAAIVATALAEPPP